VSVLRSGLDLGLDSGGLVAGSVLARMSCILLAASPPVIVQLYVYVCGPVRSFRSCVSCFYVFFMFLMRYVGLLIARLCFRSDTVLFIH